MVATVQRQARIRALHASMMGYGALDEHLHPSSLRLKLVL